MSELVLGAPASSSAKEPASERAASDRSSAIERRILSYSARGRALLHLAIAAGFFGAVVVIAQALLLSEVISRVFIGRQTLEAVRPLLALMLALAIVRAAVVGMGDVLAQSAASHLKASLRFDITRHLLALGPAFSRGERTGELVHTSTQGIEDLDEYMTVYRPLRALAVLVPVLVALVVLLIDPLSVLVLIVTGPVLVLFLVLIGSRAKELTDRRFVELSWMSAYFLDLLQGLATLKMLGRSREQVENIRVVSREYGNTTMEVLRTAFETAFILELSATIATALVAVEVGLRLVDGSLAFDRALAVLIITPEFFLPLRQLSARYHAGAAGKAAAERIFAILDTPLPPPVRDTKMTSSSLPSMAGISLEHVSFSYAGSRRPALDDVCLNIPRGTKVALLGATGAGKTTVANLLLRFIEADSGRVTVDGISLGSIEVAAWRAQVAWVPQRPHLFFGTIADNIGLARPDATREEVLAAAAAADADKFIERLPQGYDSVIGEEGFRLSGGEQQRVAIARAFLKDAPFLILDEPTSHLDEASAARIETALNRLLSGRTALIIAHRLTLAYAADQVVLMRDGRILKEGNHKDLLANDQDYRQLVASYEMSASLVR